MAGKQSAAPDTQEIDVVALADIEQKGLEGNRTCRRHPEIVVGEPVAEDAGVNQIGGHSGGLRQLIGERLFVRFSRHSLYVWVSTFLPPSTVATGKRRCLPVRLPSKLSTNSKLPSRSSRTATSAGAPAFKVPRPLKILNVRDALTVAQAITLSSGMPSIRNFDRT